jgi:hypothetical protein
MTGNVFTPRKGTTTDERHSMKLSPEDWAKIGKGRPWTAVVTDMTTGQRYVANGVDCGADFFCDAVAIPNPKQRPRKYHAPALEPGRHITGDVIREIAADYPDELRAEMRVMADTLDKRGWIEAAGHLYVTEATLRALETEAEKQVREHEEFLPHHPVGVIWYTNAHLNGRPASGASEPADPTRNAVNP